MKAKFSGHDTFPLRYGWLYKSVNYLKNGGKLQTSSEEHARNAIVDLGVGKNMVNAIKYWAEACTFAMPYYENNRYEYKASRLGEFLFGEGTTGTGVDPYLERIGSVWLVHFLLNFNYETLTAYRYFFNYSNTQNFDKKKLLDDFAEDALTLTNTEESNLSTLKKDLDCFLNTYSKKRKSNSGKKPSVVDEDHFSSPLSELNLLSESGNSFYMSELGERTSLPIEVFVFALIKFVAIENRESGIDSIDFDSLLSKPYSPGRIFRLSEAALGHKLDRAQEFTKGNVKWVDSLGLRQIRIHRDVLVKPESFVYSYYGVSRDY